MYQIPIQQQQQQQHSLFSQASWGRLEMKPERNKFKVQAHKEQKMELDSEDEWNYWNYIHIIIFNIQKLNKKARKGMAKQTYWLRQKPC